MFISDEYDTKFSIIHSNNTNFKLSLGCNIEPGKHSVIVNGFFVDEGFENK